MIYRDGFLKLLSETIGRELTEHEISYLNIIIGEEDKYFKELNREMFFDDKENEDYAFAHSITYHKLEDVKNLKVSNGWMYDRKSGIFIHGLYGGHEFLAKTLYAIYNNMDYGDDEEAEAYIIENYGCYLSRAMNMFVPIKADTFSFTDEEYVLNSSKVRGSLQWRGI